MAPKRCQNITKNLYSLSILYSLSYWANFVRFKIIFTKAVNIFHLVEMSHIISGTRNLIFILKIQVKQIQILIQRCSTRVMVIFPYSCGCAFFFLIYCMIFLFPFLDFIRISLSKSMFFLSRSFQHQIDKTLLLKKNHNFLKN